jgi:hypothetical protein
LAGRLHRCRHLLAISGLLAAVDAVARLTFTGRAHVESSPLRWFNASVEASVPTWFAVAMMFAVGIGCLRNGAAPRWAWRALGILFVYLAIDDLFCLHELCSGWMHDMLGESSRVYVWVWTMAPLFVAVALVATAAILRAAETTRAQRVLMLAGFALLAAALGFEAAENTVLESTLRPRGIPLLTYTQVLEESLELVGPVLLLAACWPTRASSGRGEISRAAAGAASAAASAARG